MKKLTILTLLSFMFVMLSQTGQSQELYDLRWKFKQADTYIIKVISTKKSLQKITTEGQARPKIEKEESFSEAKYKLSVKKNNKNSTVLSLTLVSLTMKSDSADKKMTMRAWKKNGKKHSQINIDSAKLSAFKHELNNLLKNVVEAMLDMEVTFELTKQGLVKSTKMMNNPFSKIKANTMITKMTLKMITKMLSPKEMSKMLTVELFTQLSPEPVRINSTWPVRRKYSIMGIDAEGTGTARITKVLNKKNQSIAQIKESLSYKAKTERFSKMLKDMLTDMFKTMAPNADINIDIQFKMDKAFPKVSYSEFNIEKGYNMLTKSKNVKMSMSGFMKIAFGKKVMTAKMHIDIAANTEVTCYKVVNKDDN